MTITVVADWLDSPPPPAATFTSAVVNDMFYTRDRADLLDWLVRGSAPGALSSYDERGVALAALGTSCERWPVIAKSSTSVLAVGSSEAGLGSRRT